MSPRFELTREVEIRAIHNLENPSLSEDENSRIYGVCYRQHGHNYKVRVTVTGPLDAQAGWVMSRDELDEILRRKIVEPHDGMDLNEIYANTACEALAIEFYTILESEFAPGRLVRVGIQETPKNYFEFPPEAGYS